MKVGCTIIASSLVYIDVDENRLEDDNYIAEKQREAKEQARFDLQVKELVLHNSDLDELIE